MIIKIILIIGVLATAVPLMLGQGARYLAIRRLLLMVFTAFAIASIFVPNLWTRLAHLVGVGRGTDLVLYALVIAFLGFVMRSYVRNRDLENQLTRLARRIALDEVAPPPSATPPDNGAATAPDNGAATTADNGAATAPDNGAAPVAGPGRLRSADRASGE